MVENVNKQEVFFKLLFGQNKGFLCLAFLNPVDKRDMREYWYNYPNGISNMLADIENYGAERNAYFCPQLFSRKVRKKEYVAVTPNTWADLDTCHPEKMLVTPSVIVESSPNRFQAYWLFDNTVIAPKDAEDLSRRIAYYHADEGADKSGWDLTQLLRVPETFNFKYVNGIKYPKVEIIHIKKSYYRLADFEGYPKLLDYSYTDVPFPGEELSTVSAEDLLQKYKKDLNPRIWKFFSEEPVEHKWSQDLWNMELLLFEARFTKEDVFVICREAKCNKYARDGRPQIQLWRDVCRAEETHKLNEKLNVKNPESIVQLLSKEERKIVDKLPDTFVERYIKWASGLGDAAKQYHQAGGFVLLASILCGSVKLPTSFGNIVPNLWFMILADTTLTRKTTSMDIAMDILEEVDPEAIMATDGSLEGLFSNLAIRPRKPSIFLRDEFSGLIEAMTKKDYMAGLPEMLTKLYDGKMQRRLLRKEIIEIRDPRLIIFGGGIKNKVTNALTFEHVSSGFMPRFLFITAESDVSKIKPLGPPTKSITTERTKIIEELQELREHYNAPRRLVIGDSAPFEKAAEFDATLTEEAWIRYNELEFRLVELGLESSMPDIFTPVGDRLAKSILKAALLLASSRQRLNEEVVVELEDILRAIKFGEQWRTYSEEIITNVGKNTNEHKMDLIVQHIRRYNREGTPRSRIMRTYKLTARETTAIMDTLLQRDMIYSVPSGKQVLYYVAE